MTVSLASLMVAETKATIYAKALTIAETLGLPVTSWQVGSPTRSLYHHMSEVLANLESRIVGFIRAGFLDYAGATEPASSWLILLADQVYGYTADEATYATCTVRLTNGGGGYYPLGIGEVTVKNTATGATYHNTSDGELLSGPGTTLDLTFEADSPGTDGNATIGEIDALVTGLLGVAVANTTTATGTDAESAASIVAGCRAKLGAMSPNGPADAYVYVATKAALTGVTSVTKAVTVDDSTTGDVLVYVAGPSMPISSGDVAAVQSAEETWATPLCITPTVASASALTIAVTYTKKLRAGVGKTTSEVEATDADALAALFAELAIGGDGGYLYHSLIEATLQAADAAHCYEVAVTSPAGDTALTASQVAALGTITANVTIDP